MNDRSMIGDESDIIDEENIELDIDEAPTQAIYKSNNGLLKLAELEKLLTSNVINEAALVHLLKSNRNLDLIFLKFPLNKIATISTSEYQNNEQISYSHLNLL